MTGWPGALDGRNTGLACACSHIDRILGLEVRVDAQSRMDTGLDSSQRFETATGLAAKTGRAWQAHDSNADLTK
jgi:hypothetical protein